jgi:uncharacterized protein
LCPSGAWKGIRHQCQHFLRCRSLEYTNKSVENLADGANSPFGPKGLGGRLMRRACLDTCIVIYLIEDAGRLSERTREFLARSDDTLLCVSPLVRLEVIVKPLRDLNTKLVAHYEDVLSAQSWLASDDRIFDRAAHFRAGYGLKTPDALHLAAALRYGCDECWTNDDGLDFTGLQIRQERLRISQERNS